jgi:polyferredoxin
MTMTHAGLPDTWVVFILLMSVGLAGWVLLRSHPGRERNLSFSLRRLPLLGSLIHRLTRTPYFLLIVKIIVAVIFLATIAAGLFGNPVPERNLATVLTWNLWWTGLIISIFFIGSAWCAVCPWDTIAHWLVKRRWWRRHDAAGLQLKVPKQLRNVWVALLLFIGLTWLELGVGITTSPYATALLALIMVVMATTSMAVFERKAFCHHFCPVGRTIGVYTQLAPMELRPEQQAVCTDCRSLECFHGSDTIEPCPTHLVMGRLQQNTYCTSCGACVQSCPHDNVGWRLRPMSREAESAARPRRDEAWFMLILMVLTTFHGLTMLPSWQQSISTLGQWLGDSGQLLISFSLGLVMVITVPVLLYLALIWLSSRFGKLSQRSLFNSLAFMTLPLTFTYHIAHNLSHLARESGSLAQVIANPLGSGTQPLSMMEKHMRHMAPWLSDSWLHALQAGLIIFGVWLAVRILRRRLLSQTGRILPNHRAVMLPPLLFILLVACFNLWLLSQPMVMRF